MEENIRGHKFISAPLLLWWGFIWHSQIKQLMWKKISVQIAFLLHSGMPWGSHNPFRISVRSLSISFSLMHRGERESLGHQKGRGKKINSGHLSACRPRAKTDWVPKSRQKGNPGFHCAVRGAAPIMWLMNLSLWISVFYCWTWSRFPRPKTVMSGRSFRWGEGWWIVIVTLLIEKFIIY